MTTTSPQGRTELLRPDGSPVRVLVVDDEAPLAELLSMALRYEGWEIRSAGDGAGAVRAARDFRPDAVILDVMLPDMDGLAVLGRLRRELPDVPVLFLTAQGRGGGPDRRAHGGRRRLRHQAVQPGGGRGAAARADPPLRCGRRPQRIDARRGRPGARRGQPRGDAGAATRSISRRPSSSCCAS